MTSRWGGRGVVVGGSKGGGGGKGLWERKRRKGEDRGGKVE